MTQFLQKLTQYNQNLVADFSSELSSSETIVSVTSSARVFSGLDNTPANLLSGSPTFSGHDVTQKLTGGLNGVVYAIALKALTSLSNTPVQTILVAVSYDTTSAADLITTVLGGMPSASFSSVVTGFSVVFSDTSTDSGGTIASWKWSFGDGTFSSVRNPTHVYTAVGTFTATLTITDDYSGRTSTASNPVVISAAASSLVDPPGWDGKTYNSTRPSATASATASLIFTLASNGTWNLTNHSLSVIDSGNWFYPPMEDVGALYTAKITPTLTTTGTYWTLTNPAASATAMTSNLVLNMLEHGVFDGDDFTTGTMKVDIASIIPGSTSTGTFTFTVAISTDGGGDV